MVSSRLYGHWKLSNLYCALAYNRLCYHHIRLCKRDIMGIDSKPSLLSPPASVKGATKLVRSDFTREIQIPYFQIKSSDIGYLVKVFKPYFLKLVDLKAVQDIAEDPLKKEIWLNPDEVKSSEDFEASTRQIISKYNLTLCHKTITLNYNNWKASAIIQAVLPDGVAPVTGFSTVGHIMHLNLKDVHLEYKDLIGHVFLDKITSIKTVVNKLGTIGSTYRNFRMEVLAGEESTLTTVKENGVTFSFDFATVYWNPRLSNEHASIVNLLKPHDILFDVFSGVGPFAVPAGKKRCKVYANDLNPASHKWLCHNIELNKVGNFVEAFNLDGREFIRNIVKLKLIDICGQEDATMRSVHIAMNLPAMAVEFLDSFNGLLVNRDIAVSLSPTIHCYCFVKDSNLHDVAKEMVEKSLGQKLLEDELINVHHVRSVAPNKEMMRVTFKVPKSVLSGSCVEDVLEPANKKMKI